MNTEYFKVLDVHQYGWYAYAEDDIFILGDDYPHEGGELYRGEFKEDEIPYLNEFKRDCPEAYDNAVKYFNSRLKNKEQTITEHECMNTAEMWLKAQNDGKIYECIDGDIAYSKDMGLVDKDDFNKPWGLEAWGHCGAKGLDELMTNCKWEVMKNTMTIEEAESKFGIKIIV
jgi:hypothetical protein